jgi:hypothetical protein
MLNIKRLRILYEKPSGQYIGLICDKSLTCHGLNSNLRHFGGSTTISLFHVENHVCLSRGVQVTGATWRAGTRIVARVGDLMRRTGHGQAQVEYSGTRRSRGQVMQCAVHTVHKKTRSTGLLVKPQNQGRRVVNGLASKPLGWFVSGLFSKPLGQFVSGLASKLLGRFLLI